MEHDAAVAAILMTRHLGGEVGLPWQDAEFPVLEDLFVVDCLAAVAVTAALWDAQTEPDWDKQELDWYTFCEELAKRTLEWVREGRGLLPPEDLVKDWCITLTKGVSHDPNL